MDIILLLLDSGSDVPDKAFNKAEDNVALILRSVREKKLMDGDLKSLKTAAESQKRRM